MSAEHDRDKVIDFLEKSNKIYQWFYSLPYSIFIKSNLAAEDLSNLIESNFGQKRIFITEINHSNYWGRMPEEHWNLFK